MAKNQWLRRLLAGTRGRVLAELRHGPATVSALTERLAISANAVRSHLAALERDGLVVPEQLQRQSVGKPAHQYRLTSDAQTLTPKAYDTMLDVVLTSARERAGADVYAAILDRTADRLAGPAHAPDTTLEARLADAKTLLATLGADVVIERRGNTVRLRGADCPLASMVVPHPELCGVLADVIARRLGVAVNDCCDRSQALPRCCFEAIVA